ncbi:methylated-DNA--[protein]-cysteine S-methyltransferase [Falsigemmobacter faecalis]|uniref:Methylated-DNA--protein-cysteine methyltransferase n=1 Tax=Falsigemmobacter faecalis TaxID=2488730 RepID=A0A3P3DSU4_9RHOB|nr:methylated-DNA--[protein]-cysteine S-methyltransferase [Falsigemmobacter faecalis]RRH77299.1 methylated-DNA--[protein]-cysteine S-methyltransferase [Falsigemmobacter faecalis]
MPKHWTRIATPIGDLLAVAGEEGLCELQFASGKTARGPQPDWRAEASGFEALRAQLAAYFAGELRSFDLPLAPEGTAFQHRVWALLRAIPWGQTRSYSDLARDLGQPGAARAVGAANGRNPLPILVPCHRVIGGNGSLTGFAGGIEVKRQLLVLEGVISGDLALG